MAKKQHPHIRNTPRNTPTSGVGLLPILVVGVIVIFFQMYWTNKNKDKFVNPNVIAMFKQIMAGQTINLNCHVCEGLGEFPSPQDATITNLCSVCFGSKKHTIRIISVEDKICSVCLGMGRSLLDKHTGKGVPCIICEGRGIVRKPLPDRKALRGLAFKIACETCSGKGSIPPTEKGAPYEICPICFGLGQRKIFKYSIDQSHCPACGGMGRLYDLSSGQARFCRRCSGQGFMILATNDIPAAQQSPE